MPVYLSFLEAANLSLILYVFNNFNALVANVLETDTDCHGYMKIMGQRKLLMHSASYIKHDLFSSDLVGL